MTYRVRPAAWRVLAAFVPAVALLAGGATSATAQRAGKGPLPATVDAVYRISFTALGDIGHFHFNSQVNGDTYALVADGKIDTAIFDYRGDMKSRGSVIATGTGTQPADYSYNYKQKTLLKQKKLKNVNITFNGPAVASVTPPETLSAPFILVTPEQQRTSSTP